MAGVPARLALHLVLRGAGPRAGGLGRGARPCGHRAPGAHAGRGQHVLLRDAGRGAGHHSPRPHRDVVPLRPARIAPVPQPSHLRVDRGRPIVHESYARKTTPPQLWPTPGFRDVNRRISGAWGLAFLAGDASLALAGSVDARQVLLRGDRAVRGRCISPIAIPPASRPGFGRLSRTRSRPGRGVDATGTACRFARTVRLTAIAPAVPQRPLRAGHRG